MNTKRLILILAGLLMLVAGIVIVKPVKVLPVERQAPAYTLINQAGQPVSDGDLRGQIVLYDFIYTHCTSVCPAMTGEMLQIGRELEANGWLGTDVTLVSITFDPERDTSQRLADYAVTMRADVSDWQWLTGDPIDIKRLVGGEFGVYFERVSAAEAAAAGHADHENEAGVEAYDFVHETVFVLVDEEGMIRVQYEDFEAVQWVMRDIRLLMREKNGGPLAQAVVRMAHALQAYPTYQGRAR